MSEIAQSIAVEYDRTLSASGQEILLINELRAGSEQAFAYLMSVYRNPVYNVACHIMGDETDAADVLQNVFVKVVRGIKQFRGTSSLKTWIYRIAVHEAMNYRRGWFRRHRREGFSLDDDGDRRPSQVTAGSRDDNPYAMVEQHERQEMVRRALRSLAEPYRTTVILREIENLSYEEIGEVLGVAEGTVKSRLKRGRELLRRKLAGSVAVQVPL
jgi:RNA polymerase sigma-70 factor, ECF subfamily